MAATLALVAIACRGEHPIDSAPAPADDHAQEPAIAQDEKSLRDAFEKTQRAASAATTITLYEVANAFDKDFASLEANPHVEKYPVRKRVVLSRAAAAPLVATLTTRANYFPPGDGWTCLFDPHHVLELHGASTIRVVICIHCGDVQFREGNTTLAMHSVLQNANGQLTNTLNNLIH